MSTTPRDSHDDAPGARPIGDDLAPAPDAPANDAPPPDAPANDAPGPAGDLGPAGDVGPAATPEPAPTTPPAPPTPPPPSVPGAHASPRPYPPSVPEHRGTTASAPTVPPPPSGFTTSWGTPSAATPVPTSTPVPMSTVPAPEPTAGSGAGPGTAATGLPAPAPVPEPAEPVLPAGEYRSRRDVPEAPAKPGVGRHLLGVLLGLLVTPVGLLLVGVGIARLADIAGTDDMGTDALGLSLLIGGLLILAVVVLLGIWTPALPITGGAVWGVGLGAAYLAVPDALQDLVESMTGDVPAPADQLARTAMSGYLVVVGTLVLAAGIATAVGRRRGRRWAEQVAAAERARARTEAH